MATEPFSGIYSILQTHFNKDGSVDSGSLHSEVSFVLDGSVHDIVVPTIAREFYTLSDEERSRIIDITIQEVAGRFPIIAKTSGTFQKMSIAYNYNTQRFGCLWRSNYPFLHT